MMSIQSEWSSHRIDEIPRKHHCHRLAKPILILLNLGAKRTSRDQWCGVKGMPREEAMRSFVHQQLRPLLARDQMLHGTSSMLMSAGCPHDQVAEWARLFVWLRWPVQAIFLSRFTYNATTNVITVR